MRRVGLDELEEVVATLDAFHRDSERERDSGSESEMIRARMALGILCGVLGASMLHAGDFSSYRGFQFGMDLSAAAKQAGMNSSEAIVLHQHPALMQQFDWRPRSPG